MARFNTFIYGDGTLYGGTGRFPIQDMIRVPWLFLDVVTDDEYEFAINPLDASVPSVKKTVATEYTASGQPINYEGRQPVQSFNFSGTILHEAHFNKMNEWFEKDTQIRLYDDLGRSFWIVLTSFNPTRVYVPEYPWRHEYDATATILSWA